MNFKNREHRRHECKESLVKESIEHIPKLEKVKHENPYGKMPKTNSL